MPREPSAAELAEDITELKREVRMLTDSIHRDFVRRDLHDEQIGAIRGDVAGVRTLQMWTLGILGSLAVAAIMAVLMSGVGGR